MSVNEHLRSICAYEQNIRESELKLARMMHAENLLYQKVKLKKEELQKVADRKRGETDNLRREIENRSKPQQGNFQVTIVASIIVIVITILFQLLMHYLLIDVFNCTTLARMTVAFGVILMLWCTVCLLFLRLIEVLNFFSGPICVIVFVGILYLCYLFFKHCDVRSISMSSAIIRLFLLLNVLETTVMAIYCWCAHKSDKKNYNMNKMWLRHAVQKLAVLEKEHVRLENSVKAFSESSNKSLNMLRSDITNLMKSIETSKKSLAALYAKNIIHPNYQNWVAAATIYEYLDVGRCYELKGPNGAYNLYEKELLAKQILSSISAINSSINHYGTNISNSQMYIRRQLQECNEHVANLKINTYGL